MLLLDTEGEDDVGTSQKQDMRIYALTAMMSSMLVRYESYQVLCYCFKLNYFTDLQCYAPDWSR